MFKRTAAVQNHPGVQFVAHLNVGASQLGHSICDRLEGTESHWSEVTLMWKTNMTLPKMSASSRNGRFSQLSTIRQAAVKTSNKIGVSQAACLGFCAHKLEFCSLVCLGLANK